MWEPPTVKRALPNRQLQAHWVVRRLVTASSKGIKMRYPGTAVTVTITPSSRKINLAQQKYSAYNRELLAIYEAVKHFHHMLEA
jgi:hypothetical protein